MDFFEENRLVTCNFKVFLLKFDCFIAYIGVIMAEAAVFIHYLLSKYCFGLHQ